jgi:hypothetical protein
VASTNKPWYDKGGLAGTNAIGFYSRQDEVNEFANLENDELWMIDSPEQPGTVTRAARY